MDEGNRHAALADGRGDAFDRAQSHITAGEDARRAGFKEIGIAAERPAPGFFQIVSGEDVSARVARDVGWQPRGFRVGADEDEQAAAIMPAHFRAGAVADVDRGQVGVAVNPVYLRPS